MPASKTLPEAIYGATHPDQLVCTDPKWGWVLVTPTTMPDADATVLGYSPEWESEPVWPCFFDGEDWCEVSAEILITPPTHWMNFPEPPKS